MNKINIKLPLVSVIVYNYNYGRFLNQCLKSIFEQSYQNIEVLFSDNGSTDQSWDIALKWQKKYPNKMFVARNRANFGTDANIKNCQINKRGKYHLVVGSDDTINKNFIRDVVKKMEEYKEAGFCMVNRNIMSSNGKITKEKPFYNCDALIYPPGQSLVYTVAACNPSITQIVYRTDLTDASSVPDGSFGATNYGTRILDFNLSLKYPIIYLKNAYINHRIHEDNQSLKASEDLDEVIGQHQLGKLFIYKLNEKNFNKNKILEYKDKMSKQYSELSIRYCKRELLKNNITIAKKYLYLSVSFSDSNIESTDEWIKLDKFFKGKIKYEEIKKFIQKNYNYQRNKSYTPPKPYKEI